MTNTRMAASSFSREETTRLRYAAMPGSTVPETGMICTTGPAALAAAERINTKNRTAAHTWDSFAFGNMANLILKGIISHLFETR
jgi:hypothetical protein